MKKGWYYTSFIVACLTAWLVINHIAGFTPHDYFYEMYPDIKKYVGVNVVSRWADLTFFTYQTLIFFSLWLFAFSLGGVFKLKKLYALATHKAVVVFVLTKYTVTAVLYTAFECIGGKPTFGLYALHNAAIHNFGTNILAHYVFFVFCWVLGKKLPTHGKMTKKHYIVFLGYMCAYYATTKSFGKYCYQIEWYPYPIFDGESLWQIVGGSRYEEWKGTLLLFFVLTVIGGGYLALLCLVNKAKGTEKNMENGIKKELGWAFVTGATGGLGKAFVSVLAKKGYALFLTGRSQEKLHNLQTQIQKEYPLIKVDFCAADLSDAQSREGVMDYVRAAGYKISLLVNAAGADIQKGLAAYTQQKIVFQSRVNFEAAVSLCHFALQEKAEKLEIVNISSVSGIYPMPYFAIYSATKGALTSFSVSLREEMKGKNVSVTAVLPGAMPTREDVKEQIKGQGLWGRLAAKTPEWVAEYSLKAVAKNKRKVIPGVWNKMMRISTGWLPTSWRLRFIANRWSKISKDAF